MNQLERRTLAGIIALTALSGCLNGGLPGTASKSRLPAPHQTGNSSVSPSSPQVDGGTELVGANGSSPALILPTAPGQNTAFDPATTFEGRVFAPPGLIGNNGASLVGNNGASLVGNNGGNLIGNNGGSLIGNNGASFRLNQRPLAYATITVADAAGQPRNSADGTPQTFKSDEQGRFLLPKSAIPVNSILVVSADNMSGKLSAFVEKGGGSKSVQIDAVSSLTAVYVSERFVSRRQEILDRYTENSDLEAQEAISASLQSNSNSPLILTDTASILKSTTRLIEKFQSVTDIFEKIEKQLLIFGTTDERNERDALSVSLGTFEAMTMTPEGLFLYDRETRRLRLLKPTGTISDPLGYDELPTSQSPLSEVGMAYSNGKLYLSDSESQKIFSIAGSKIELVAGTDAKGAPSEDGFLATETNIEPASLAISSAGQVYFCETFPHRVRTIDSTGRVRTVAGTGQSANTITPNSLANVRLDRPLQLAFDSLDNLYVLDIPSAATVNKIDLTKGTIELAAPISLTASKNWLGIFQDRIIIAQNSSWLYELEDQKRKLFIKEPPSLVEYTYWSPSSEPICFDADNLYTQNASGQIVRMPVANPSNTQIIGGLKSSKDGTILRRAVASAVNQENDFAVCDIKSNRIYLNSKNVLSSIGGNGEYDFVSHSNNVTESPLYAPKSLIWHDKNSVYFLAGRGSCVVQRITIGAKTLDTLAIGPRNLIAEEVMTGIPVLRGEPTSIQVSTDGRVLIFCRGGFIDEVRDDGILPYFSIPGSGTIEETASGASGLYYYEVESGQFSKLQSNTITPAAKIEEFRSLLEAKGESLGNWSIGPLAITNDDILYVGTWDDQIFRKDLKSNTVALITGPTGKIFKGNSPADTLKDLTDIDVLPSGDLLITTYDKVVRIPASLLGQ